MAKKPKKLVWFKPDPISQLPEIKFKVNDLGVDDKNIIPPLDRGAVSPLLQIIAEVGIPIFPEVTNIKDYTIELLKLASEVEHALMAQYLYACFSVSDHPGDDNVNYQEKILDIAIQEMGHLATVQNLLLLVGGPENFYVQRDRLRSGSPINPIPFITEPLSIKSLAQYVIAEKPSDEFIPEGVKPLVIRLQHIVAEEGVTVHRVGIIYELLKWIFTPEGEAEASIDFSQFAPLPPNPHLNDSDLVAENILLQYEALREEWGVFEEEIILQTIHTCSEAREAISKIAEQGEGLANKDISHFGEFLEIVIAFEENRVTVKPMAKSPTLGLNGPSSGTLIQHPYTKLWGEVFSIQYSLLVLSIHHGLATARVIDQPGLREGIINTALTTMRRIIEALTNLLSELPIANDPANVAGPPYDLASEILDVDVADMPMIQLVLLVRLESLYKQIEASADFANFPSHANDLKNLRNIDKKRRSLFPMSA